jgi:hypothetical protein
MKQTKEDLIKENATLKERLNQSEFNIKDIKKDFCIILGFNKPIPLSNDFYPRVGQKGETEWAEIFAEIGRLKAVQDIRNLEEMMRATENHVTNLEKSLMELSPLSPDAL